jgi:mutator protein MutT
LSGVPQLHVVAGVLIGADGRVLLAQRPPGKAFAGRWEFPGGKVDPGESALAALVRELDEELGIAVEAATPLLAVAHRYPGAPNCVLIDAWRVNRWSGEPAPLDGQQLRWCTPDALPEADILEADRPIVTALRLPTFLGAADGARLVVDPVDIPAGAVALYRDAARFRIAADRRSLAGLIVHDAASAAEAVSLGADFLVVSSRLVDAEQRRRIAALGLPWYAVADIEGSSATGRIHASLAD